MLCCLNQKIPSLDATGRLIEISGQNNKTRLAVQIATSAINLGQQNQILILDCDGRIKADSINQSVEAKDFNRVRFHRIFDWNDYQMALAMLPEIIFQLPQLNMIVIDGLSNPYFVQERKMQHGSSSNMSQQISRLYSILEPHNVTVVVTVHKACNDLQIQNPIRITSLSGKNGKSIVEDISKNERFEIDL